MYQNVNTSLRSPIVYFISLVMTKMEVLHSIYCFFYNKHHILERIQSSVLRWSFLASFWAPLNSTWMVQGCVYVIHDQKSAQPVLMAYAWSIWCTNLLIAETYIYILKNDLFFEPVINMHIFSRDGIWFSCNM